jgi:predicted DNA-binding WGR domain protein
MARQFQYSEGTSNKFWEISRSGPDVTVRFGRIGSAGKAERKRFSDEPAAIRHMERLIGEKLKKGYREKKGVKQREFVPAIDLQKEAIEIQKMLAAAVQSYTAKHEAVSSAKRHPPITRIELSFSLGDSVSTPWIYLQFDTKPGSIPDGDPTHPCFAKSTRKAWLPAIKAACDDREVVVTTPRGKKLKCNAAQLTKTIGKFLVDMLLQARAHGVFADLPKADRCELGVEDPTSGEFGWPKYNDRGMRNLVKQVIGYAEPPT